MNLSSNHARNWLRLEGLAVCVLCLFLYEAFSSPWSLFAVGFFAPDLSLLGYIRGAKTGALIYNLGHTYSVPLVLLAGAFIMDIHLDWARNMALIWSAHIGFDRALGYGLKYPSGYSDTHVGTIGVK